MVFVTKSNVLTIGISDTRIQALRELPIRVINVRFANEAVSSFRNKNIDSVISRWDLMDMPNGELLEGIRSIKPDLPTVAIIEHGNIEQEIAARSLGVSAVLTDDCSREHFIEVVAQVLGLSAEYEIAAIYADEGNMGEKQIID